MALHISFGYEVDSVLIAELVPAVVVRIMAGAYCVDVELLHQLDILYHPGLAHGIAPVRVELVAVGTLEEYWLAVDEHLCVPDFYLAESYLNRYGFAAGAGVEGIEVWSLCRPLVWVGDLHLHTLAPGCGSGHFPALSIPEAQAD